jgi:hypothetical protein
MTPAKLRALTRRRCRSASGSLDELEGLGNIVGSTSVEAHGRVGMVAALHLPVAAVDLTGIFERLVSAS